MANKYHTYFGQIITNSELNEIFDSLFVEVDRFIQDFGYRGIVTGGNVAQHSPTNLSVDIDGPTIVYDQEANRMAFASLTNVPLSLDENGAATPVVGSLNEKWLSLFMEFVSTPTDPRTDDLGDTVYFKDVESYRINVVQGSEAAIGTPTKPALRADQILIADVLLGYGVTSIVNAKISDARSEVAYDLTGTPLAVRSKNFTEVLQQFLDALNDGLTAIATLDVDDMIADALTGSPTSIPSGNMHGILQTMLNAVNTARTNADNAQTSANTAQSTANSAQSAVTTLDGLAGKKAVANIWTATQTFDFNECDDSHPVRKVTKTAADHPSSAGNKWKLIDRLTLANGRIVRYFSGAGATSNWCITHNASWDPASGAQTWSKDNTASESNILRCVEGELHYYGRNSGAGTWTDSQWDAQQRGVLYVGDTVAAKLLLANSFEFEPDLTFTDPVPFAGAWGDIISSSLFGGALLFSSAPGTITIPLRVRRGVVGGNLRIAFSQGSATPIDFEIFQRVVNYSAAGIHSFVTTGLAVSGSASPGYQLKSLLISGFSFDPSEEYVITCSGHDAADLIQGMRVIGNVAQTVSYGL